MTVYVEQGYAISEFVALRCNNSRYEEACQAYVSPNEYGRNIRPGSLTFSKYLLRHPCGCLFVMQFSKP